MKMMRYLLIAFLLPSLSVQAQDYFQQRVDYSINVSLNDVSHELYGDISFIYTNNSPDVLDTIWMHLWPNAYKDGNTALAQQMMRNGNTSLYYASEEDRGFIDMLDFTVNDKKVELVYHEEYADVAKLGLDKPLKPGEVVKVSTPFRVKLPSGRFSRLGHIGQAYTITQWYPKPAVYDREGWHEMPYLNQGEFYSEFGSFEVSITVPKNYVLGATGNMVDCDEELAWLKEKSELTKSMIKEEIPFATNENGRPDMTYPESSKENKTLRFEQENVHDFAWFCDKRYHVLHGTVELPHSKREVDTWAMFTNSEAHLWVNSIEYLNDATYYYSLWNGDYPYDHVTAVDGTISAGGGMEYPNITVIGRSGDARSLETVIMHEVGHNWFYGILGSNERDHAWMDEGLNSFNENRYLETKYKDEVQSAIEFPLFGLDELDHKGLFEAGYLYNATRNFDQPIEYHSDHYTSINYGAIVYGKTALVFDYMKDYLGTATFDKCMQAYFERWKFKHPQPNDLRQVFEEITKKDLSWFFDDIIDSKKALDYKIGAFKKGEAIKVVNTGQIAGPFSVSELSEEGEIISTTWFEGFDGSKELPLKVSENTKRLQLDALGSMPEVNRQNNHIRTKGLFRKVEPIKLRFLGRYEDYSTTDIYWLPLLGYNESNKFMVGMAVYNSVIPTRKLDYVLAPMYSFSSEALTGYGEIGYNFDFRDSRVFNNIRLAVSGAQFGLTPRSTQDDSYLYFSKITPKLNIRFAQKTLNSPALHELQLRRVHAFETTEARFSGSETISSITFDQQYNELNYRFKHDLPLHPYQLDVQLQHHRNFVKSSATFTYSPVYGKHGKQIQFRLFGGHFLQNELAFNAGLGGGRFNWQVGGQNGLTDYTYDAVFLDRSGINRNLRQQFVDNEGAFKAPVSGISSDSWLTAANVKMELPFRFLVTGFGLFGDFALYPVANNINGQTSTSSESIYDLGVYLPVVPDAFEIYFPLLVSENLQDQYDFQNISFKERIRFTLNLNLAQPFDLIRRKAPH